LCDVPPYADNNHWMYPLQIDKARYGKDRDTLMKNLAAEKIQSRPVWLLNHQQKPYATCQHYRIEEAYRMWEQTLNLPCGVGLKDEEIDRVIEHLAHG